MIEVMIEAEVKVEVKVKVKVVAEAEAPSEEADLDLELEASLDLRFHATFVRNLVMLSNTARKLRNPTNRRRNYLKKKRTLRSPAL